MPAEGTRLLAAIDTAMSPRHWLKAACGPLVRATADIPHLYRSWIPEIRAVLRAPGDGRRTAVSATMIVQAAPTMKGGLIGALKLARATAADQGHRGRNGGVHLTVRAVHIFLRYN